LEPLVELVEQDPQVAELLEVQETALVVLAVAVAVLVGLRTWLMDNSTVAPTVTVAQVLVVECIFMLSNEGV
jgi:hypothetical protein